MEWPGGTAAVHRSGAGRQGGGARRWRSRLVGAGVLLCLALAACGSDAAAPTAAPGILSHEPAAGAVGVPVTSAVRITFRWPVELPAEPGAAVWVQHGATRIPTHLSRPDERTVVLEPVDAFDAGTVHTVHVGPGIAHAGGVVAESQWSFTTAGLPLPGLDGTRLLGHVAALAHDSMHGRGYGSIDELRAADYLRTEMARYGLTAFSGDAWLHTFPGERFVGTSQNVIGVLWGTGSLRDDWVVVGAHYDHLGVLDGFIHNGADDNASGTAAMLEMARTLAAYAAEFGFGSPDRRSIMFIGFGAEEAGLLGSNHFCREPLVPLPRVSAMLNLDMIGRLRGATLYLGGAAPGGIWSALLQRYDPALSYVLLGFINSDHVCFLHNGRPALALFTGTHPQYHQPEDDVHLIDLPGLIRVGDLALRVAANLAVRPVPIGH